jgi:hypothetical protein
LSKNSRRALWSLALTYALASATYAIGVAVDISVTEQVGNPSPFVPVILIGHILFYLVASEEWSRYSDERWKGLVLVSDGAKRAVRVTIHVLAGALLLGGALVPAAIRILAIELAPETWDRYAAVVVSAAIVFGSVVYGSCSLLGGDSIRSRGPGPWARFLNRVGRAYSARKSRR